MPYSQVAVQEYGRYGVHGAEDKQKLFRLIKRISLESFTFNQPQLPKSSPRKLNSGNSDLTALAATATQLDGNLQILDLDGQDDDLLVSTKGHPIT